jgi:transcriptional regulator with XRE-family HTH domain
MPRKQLPRRPNSIDVVVGGNVRIWRMAKGLSQHQLASRLGITFQQVQKYEVGANRIGTGRLVKISAILGVPVAALFQGTDRGDPTAALLSLISDSRSFRLAHAFTAIKNSTLRLALVGLAEKIAEIPQSKKRRRRR